MKLNGIMGKGSGKLGSSVWGISGGVQVVREYNPVVTNPQTAAQVAQRAKFKLMTQLAAALEDAIAFRKSGLTSARNQFVSVNIGLATFSDEKAKVQVDRLDLTGGVGALPGLTFVHGEGNNGTISLNNAAAENIDRVLYFVYSGNTEEQLSLTAQLSSSTPGNGRTFEVTVSNDVIDGFEHNYIFAYGVKNLSEAGKTKFDNYYIGETATGPLYGGVVEILRTLSASEYSLTETQGILVES